MMDGFSLLWERMNDMSGVFVSAFGFGLCTFSELFSLPFRVQMSGRGVFFSLFPEGPHPSAAGQFFAQFEHGGVGGQDEEGCACWHLCQGGVQGGG